jgi:hypothetical protein
LADSLSSLQLAPTISLVGRDFRRKEKGRLVEKVFDLVFLLGKRHARVFAMATKLVCKFLEIAKTQAFVVPCVPANDAPSDEFGAISEEIQNRLVRGANFTNALR